MDRRLMIQYAEDLYEFHSKDGDVNMIKYIRHFKHLIGCEFEFCGVKATLSDVKEFEYLLKSSPKYVLSNFKLYLLDKGDFLVNYETYMKFHYPEYRYVWEEQICKCDELYGEGKYKVNSKGGK